jgi:hypothetical protein
MNQASSVLELLWSADPLPQIRSSRIPSPPTTPRPPAAGHDSALVRAGVLPDGLAGGVPPLHARPRGAAGSTARAGGIGVEKLRLAEPEGRGLSADCRAETRALCRLLGPSASTPASTPLPSLCCPRRRAQVATAGGWHGAARRRLRHEAQVGALEFEVRL